MRKYFSATQKIEIIKKVLEDGQTVYSVCKQYGISKVSFYKWLAQYNSGRRNRFFALSNGFCAGTSHPRSLSYKQQLAILSLVHKTPTFSCRMIARRLGIGHHGVQTLLERKHLSRYQDRINFSRRPFWKRETADRRLGMMELLESGWKAKDICAHFGVSKITFNKWRRIYLQSEKRSSDILADRYISGQAHPRRLPQELEKRVLAVVSSNPQFSVHQIHRHLAGEVGHHGIQNVLNRADLNTFEKRIAHVGPLQAPKIQVAPAYQPVMPMYKLRMLLAPFVTVPKLLFTNPKAAIGPFLLLLAPLLFLAFFIKTIFTSPSGSSVGLFFAAIALIFGLFFFIYSMKYYITILMVLRLAQSEGRGKSQPEAGRPLAEKLSPLNVDLSKVELLEHPFVSIHVALYNEKQVAERLIRACTSQEWHKEVQSGKEANYEVVIADDSTDKTTDIVRQVLIEGLGYKEVRTFYDDELEIYQFVRGSSPLQGKQLPTVKLIHRFTRTGFKGGALQKALEQTDERAAYVAVFDADFVPYLDTIEQFMKSFQVTCGGLEKVKESNVAAVQGYQWHVLNKSQTWVTRGVRTEYAGSYVIERSGAEIYGGLKQIAGSVYMIRADVLRGFGWGTSITEDFELTLRLYENGWKVAFTPYIQAPAEAVSTIKKLIRQRMRWAEGASFNIKVMLARMLKSPHLTRIEKAEFLYLAPYYLQAAFFIVGTLAWFLSEAVLHSRLPFWTAAFGWSLVFTNLLALPLMNIIGLFLEESDERDYVGIFSFIVLSYIVVPFQAYAAIKGFLETSEGPWFRTPKTGAITDTFGRPGFGKFFGNIFGKPAPVAVQRGVGSAFNNFSANLAVSQVVTSRKGWSWMAKSVLVVLLVFTTTLFYVSHGIPLAEATNWASPLTLDVITGETGTVFPAWGNWLSTTGSYASYTAIVHDNTTSVASLTTESSTTMSHIVGSGSNRFLIVGVSYLHDTNTITGVTYSGAAMTAVPGGSATIGNRRSEMWYLVAPASGTNNVVITFSGTVVYKTVGASSYTGVNQSIPLGTAATNTGSDAAPTVNVSSAANELVIDSAGADTVSFTAAGGSQTIRWNPDNTGTIAGAGSTQPGAATVTMSWTLSASTDWATVGVGMKPAGGGQFARVGNQYSNVGQNNYFWLSNLWPTGGNPARIPPGNYYVQFAKSGNGTVGGTNNMTVAMQLFLTSNNGTTRTSLASNSYTIRQNNADNNLIQFSIGNLAGSNITSSAKNRLAFRMMYTAGSLGCRSNVNCYWNLLLNNSGAPARLIIPANITVPEIPKPVIFVIMMIVMPVVPAIISGRYRKKGRSIITEFGMAWQDLVKKLLGLGEEGLDELPV